MMRGLAYIIKPDEEAPDILTLPQPPTQHQLHQMVGGVAIRVPHFKRYRGRWCIAFCGENFPEQPFNRLATRWWHHAEPSLRMKDYLAGVVVMLLGDDDFMAAIDQ
jgi:hypothetical protein